MKASLNTVIQYTAQHNQGTQPPVKDIYLLGSKLGNAITKQGPFEFIGAKMTQLTQSTVADRHAKLAIPQTQSEKYPVRSKAYSAAEIQKNESKQPENHAAFAVAQDIKSHSRDQIIRAYGPDAVRYFAAPNGAGAKRQYLPAADAAQQLGELVEIFPKNLQQSRTTTLGNETTFWASYQLQDGNKKLPEMLVQVKAGNIFTEQSCAIQPQAQASTTAA